MSFIIVTIAIIAAFVFIIILTVFLLKTIFVWIRKHVEKVRNKKLKAMIVLISIIVFIFISCMMLINSPHFKPGKMAVYSEDFQRYNPYIIIHETYYAPGTGWEILEEENGNFITREEIIIDGNKPPSSIMPNTTNKFLCKVQYDGLKLAPGYETEDYGAYEEVDCNTPGATPSYNIIEWYPIYPVVHDDLFLRYLKNLRNYLTEEEVRKGAY